MFASIDLICSFEFDPAMLPQNKKKIVFFGQLLVRFDNIFYMVGCKTFKILFVLWNFSLGFTFFKQQYFIKFTPDKELIRKK